MEFMEIAKLGISTFTGLSSSPVGYILQTIGGASIPYLGYQIADKIIYSGYLKIFKREQYFIKIEKSAKKNGKVIKKIVRFIDNRLFDVVKKKFPKFGERLEYDAKKSLIIYRDVFYEDINECLDIIDDRG